VAVQVIYRNRVAGRDASSFSLRSVSAKTAATGECCRMYRSGVLVPTVLKNNCRYSGGCGAGAQISGLQNNLIKKKKKSEKNIVLFVQLACLKNYPCGSGAQMSGSSHPKHFGSVSAPPAVHALRSPKSNSNKWLRSHAGVCFGEIVLSDQIRRALMLTASHSLETKISSSRFVFTPPVPSVPTYVTAEASRGRLVVRWRPPASPGGIVTSYSVECRCSRRNAFGLVTQTRRTSGT